MAFETRVTLTGSDRQPVPGAQQVGPVQKNELVSVTVILRRKGAVSSLPSGTVPGEYPSREEFADAYGANPADVRIVEKFAHASQLAIVESSLPKRRVMLLGTADAMSKAFGTELANYQIQQTGVSFRGRTGTLTIPVELEGIVIAVLGLDTRPVAQPHFRLSATPIPAQPSAPAAVTPPAGTFTPPQVATLYNFPGGANGTGQTIGIVELGGGYSTTDLATYFSDLGLTEPGITAVSVDGGTNSPGSDADAEVMLDIEVAGSIAPGANIAVYFAPNTDQGFVDAITDAVHDTTRKPSVVSISWGGAEDSWTQQSQTAMNNALQDAATLGVTVTIAAGDNGSSDGVGDGNLHVDFPASSPYSLACGGTTLQGSNGAISSEVVWNEIANNEGATGGGVSNVFALPSYQSSAGVPAQPQTGFVGRGVPDVAGDADPTTGYYILVDGQTTVVGGTSAVAPLWAALVALINQQLGRSVGFVNASLYAAGSSFNDITSGSNDDSGLGYYNAGPGWDPCTGLGSPNGGEILAALSSGGTTSASERRVPIPGSAPKPDPQATVLPAAVTRQEITATIVLRRRADAGAGSTGAEALLSGEVSQIPREDALRAIAADPEDLAAVCSFLQNYGLAIVDENAESRTIRVRGTAEQMDAAFDIQLRRVKTNDGQQYLTYEGPLSVPQDVSGIITAVLGLDQRPVAQHRARGTA
ncbi:MAG: S8 family serine peptidase [Acidobacteriaceae bacterium]|nr:S8 family serine peptidase [Acidobacteriaceae bacterium]MBV9780479.1 S8 family serine peptidase [Acidobacteriaceae bacterium]